MSVKTDVLLLNDERLFIDRFVSGKVIKIVKGIPRRIKRKTSLDKASRVSLASDDPMGGMWTQVMDALWRWSRQ